MRKQNIFKALTLMSAAAVVLTFGSCEKKSEEEDVQPTTETKTGLLTSSGWVMNAGTATFLGQTINIMDNMDECEKDDIMTFNTDGTMMYDEGATKCDSNDAQINISGTWAFASNETDLVIDDDGEVQVFDIVTLTSSDLKLTQTQFDSTFMTDITITAEFKH